MPETGYIAGATWSVDGGFNTGRPARCSGILAWPLEFLQRVLEEIGMNLPGPGGGEVVSTESIAWSGALLHNGTRNGVSRMTENVLRAFVARRSQPAAAPALSDVLVAEDGGAQHLSRR
jgi:hypothetical protein